MILVIENKLLLRKNNVKKQKNWKKGYQKA